MMYPLMISGFRPRARLRQTVAGAIRRLGGIFFAVLAMFCTPWAALGQAPITISATSLDQTLANTIQDHLNDGVSVFVENSNPNADLIVASGVTLAKTSGGDATLTLKSARQLYISSNNAITSTSGKLNLVFWSNSGNTGGILRFGHGIVGGAEANVLIRTNGGHYWAGGGSGTSTWNGLTVGDGYALGGVVASGSIPWFGLELYGGTRIFTDGGNVSLNGASTNQPATVGVILVRSLINSGSGTIEVRTDVNGSAGAGSSAYGLFLQGDGGFSSTTGDISFTNVIRGSSEISRGVYLERTDDGLPVISSAQGLVAISNDLSASSSPAKYFIDIDESSLTRERPQIPSTFTETVPAILSGASSLYSSSAPVIATVDDAGLVTIVSAGTTDITGTYTRTDWQSIPSRWRYRVAVVDKADPELVFPEATVSKLLTDDSFTQSAIQQNQSGGTSGTISYSSSNRSVATVHPSTGEVSIEGEGTTVITATSASTTTYAQGSASYTLTVTGGAEPQEAPGEVENVVAFTGLGQVTLTFTPASDGGSPITNYQYTLDGGNTWTPFDPAVTTSPATISELTGGTEYTIQLRAVNDVGSGPASAVVSATPLSIQGLGAITIVQSGGDAEGTTWSYQAGLLIPTVDTPVNVDAADVLIKLGLGDLTVAGSSVTVAANVVHIANGNSLTLKGAGNVILSEGRRIEMNGGDVIFWADADGSRVGGIRIGSDFANIFTTKVQTDGGDIVLGGGSDPRTGFAHYSPGLGAAFSEYRFAIGVFGATLDANSTGESGGNIIIRGSAGDTFNGLVWTTNIGGQYGSNTVIRTNGSGTITIEGDGSEAPANATPTNSRNSWATAISGTVQTESGAILLIGKSNPARTNARGFSLSGIIQSASGEITIDDRTQGTTSINYTGPFINGAQLGRGGLLNSSSDITFMADRAFFNPTVNINTSGSVRVEPAGPSFTSDFTFGGVSVAASSLNIGGGSNTANITVASALVIDGPIEIRGGNLTLTAPLTATDSEIRLHATGTVMQGAEAPLAASDLLLSGPGTFSLTNEGNLIGRVAGGSTTAGGRLGSIAITDASGGLTIGVVDEPDEGQGAGQLGVQANSSLGLHATGTILIETLEGDLTLAASLSTEDGSANAVILNAGRSEEIGTVTGGDIQIADTGTPTLSFGEGGIAKLFSGSEANSTGLTEFVGGASNVRREVDETTLLFTPALTAGQAHALYREAVRGSTPEAPTELVATPRDGAIEIAFTEGEDGGSPITNYEYTLDGGDTWIPFDPEVTVSPVTISGLTNGTEYTVQLRAVNADGAGEASEAVTATPALLLSIVEQPSTNALTGVSFATQPRIRLIDASGAAVAREGIEVTAALASGEGTLGGTVTVTTDEDGVATFVDLSITGEISEVTLSFSAAGLTPVTSSAIAIKLPPTAPEVTEVEPWEESLIVTFNAPASDGGTPILNYEYTLDGGDTWFPMAPATTKSPLRIEGLENGTEYEVAIRAVTVLAAGEASEIFRRTPVTLQAPAAPGVPTVVPGAERGTLVVTVPELPDLLPEGTDRPETYTVAASPSGATCTMTWPDRSCTLTGVMDGESQTIAIFATNPGGDSPVTTALPTISGEPDAPAAPTVERLDRAVRVTVETPPAGGTPTSYIITASPGGATCTVLVPETSCVVDGLENGQSYTFTATAVNARGTSQPSAPSASVVPALLPGAPEPVMVEPGPGQLTVTWTAPPVLEGVQVTGYQVEYKLLGTSTWVTLDALGADQRDAVLDGLTPGASYRIRVAALTRFGLGEWGEPTQLGVPLSMDPAIRVTTTLSTPQPALGDTVTVTITVRSFGGVAAENIELEVTPDQPRLRVLTWRVEDGALDASNLIWRIASLAPGAQVVLEFDAVVIEGVDEDPIEALGTSGMSGTSGTTGGAR